MIARDKIETVSYMVIPGIATQRKISRRRISQPKEVIA
jgi:hypothetical protein